MILLLLMLQIAHRIVRVMLEIYCLLRVLMEKFVKKQIVLVPALVAVSSYGRIVMACVYTNNTI